MREQMPAEAFEDDSSSARESDSGSGDSSGKPGKKKLTAEEKRKITIRWILLVLAIIVAGCSFAYAIRSFIHRDPGYYTVDAQPDADCMFYASGVKFMYYFEGSSDDIRREQSELKSAYSGALSRFYKLLDAKNTYTGYSNIATINSRLNQNVEIDRDLFEILTDALELTEQGRFNLFAGALYEEWMSIFVLSDPTESDPLTDPGMDERIRGIAQIVNDKSNFDLVVVDAEKYVVRLEVSDAYISYAAENELSPAILNLGGLREAYELRSTNALLEKAGYNTGYFTTDSGLVVAMSNVHDGAYLMHGWLNEVAEQACSLDMRPGSVGCIFRSFDAGENDLNYVVDTDGTVRMRHPHFTSEGEISDILLSTMVIDLEGDPVKAALISNELLTARTENEIGGIASRNASDKMLIAFIKRSEPNAVYTDPANAAMLVSVSPDLFEIKNY